MQIEYINPNILKAADYNPRQMTEKQAEDLKKSIEKFGLVDPIIVNKHPGRENIVIGGHQRLRIAQVLGFNTVPVVYLDLDEEKEKELNLRLNKNLGEWDWDLMASLDTDLLLSVGFDEKELDFAFGLNKTVELPELSNDGVKVRSITIYLPSEEMDRVEGIIGQFDGRTISDKVLSMATYVEDTKLHSEAS